jgi:hypothetical protein
MIIFRRVAFFCAGGFVVRTIITLVILAFIMTELLFGGD